MSTRKTRGAEPKAEAPIEPPMPRRSIATEEGESDPAGAMLKMVREIGGCYQLQGQHDRMPWVVPLVDGGIQRFPAPVGTRLVSQGILCRHPHDVPGSARRFVRFIPKERMPTGFEFNLSEATKQVQAEIRQKQIKARIEERKIWFAAIAALRLAKKAKQAEIRGGA